MKKKIILIVALSLIYSGFVVFMYFKGYTKGFQGCYEWMKKGITIELPEGKI